MLKKERLVHFVDKRCRQIAARLVAYCATGEGEELHQLRVEVKKINALVHLLQNSASEKGQKVAPKDEEIPALLGQIYSQQAQTASGKEKEKLEDKAADSFAASAEAQPDNAEAYLLAGQAYDQAGQPAEAIQYYNQYLDRAPQGEDAAKVKDRISALLEGKESTSSAQP